MALKAGLELLVVSSNLASTMKTFFRENIMSPCQESDKLLSLGPQRLLRTLKPQYEVWGESVARFLFRIAASSTPLFWMLLLTSFNRRVIRIYGYSRWTNVVECVMRGYRYLMRERMVGCRICKIRDVTFPTGGTHGKIGGPL